MPLDALQASLGAALGFIQTSSVYTHPSAARASEHQGYDVNLWVLTLVCALAADPGRFQVRPPILRFHKQPAGRQ